MKYPSLMLATLIAVAGLSACEKSTVVTPPAAAVSPVPGPAGPAGPQGEAGKSGTNSVVVVPGEKATETK